MRTPAAPAHLRERVKAEAGERQQSARRRRRLPSLRLAAAVGAPALAALMLALLVVGPDQGPRGLSPDAGLSVPPGLSEPKQDSTADSDAGAGSSSGQGSESQAPAAPEKTERQSRGGKAGAGSSRRPSGADGAIAPDEPYAYPVPDPTSEPVREVATESLVYVKQRAQLSENMATLYDELRTNGGYVESLRFSLAGEQARLVLKLPVAATPQLLASFSELGVLVTQRGHFKDLTPRIAPLDKRIRELNERIAKLTPVTTTPYPLTKPDCPECATPSPQRRGGAEPGASAPDVMALPPQPPSKLTRAQRLRLKELGSQLEKASTARQKLVDGARHATMSLRLTSERPAALSPKPLERLQSAARVLLPFSLLALALVGLALVARRRR